MPKVSSKKMDQNASSAAKKQRHDPLHVDILGADLDSDNELHDGGNAVDGKERKKLGKKDRQKQKRGMDEATQKKIIQAAVMQQKEFNEHYQSSEEEEEDDDAMDAQESAHVDGEGEEEFEEEVLELDENDAMLLDGFFGTNAKQQQQPRQIDLGAMILEKIREREIMEGKDQQQQTQSEEDIRERIHPKVYMAYTKIGKLLKIYRSGPLPKAFKAIPRLANWEDILYITKPEKWSNHAVYAATVIFASTNDDICQRFLNVIVLPRLVEDMESSKKLNPHLYQSLMKGMYRPGSFFKGIVLPMCEDGCTARQAAAVCSVINKKHVPKLHSAAALLKITQMGFTSSTLLFVKCLVEKQYALPSRVVDAVVDYFYLAMKVEDRMPVIWHQALLSFVQIYKLSFTKEHKKSLYALVKTHLHPKITVVIRMELSSKSGSRALGEQSQEQTAAATDIMDDDDE